MTRCSLFSVLSNDNDNMIMQTGLHNLILQALQSGIVYYYLYYVRLDPILLYFLNLRFINIHIDSQRIVRIGIPERIRIAQRSKSLLIVRIQPSQFLNDGILVVRFK